MLEGVVSRNSLHSSIYKYQPISTKLGQNIYEILVEFNYGPNLIGWEQLELFALNLQKMLLLTLFTL